MCDQLFGQLTSAAPQMFSVELAGSRSSLGYNPVASTYITYSPVFSLPSYSLPAAPAEAAAAAAVAGILSSSEEVPDRGNQWRRIATNC